MKKNMKSPKNQPGKKTVKKGKASITSGTPVRGKSQKKAAIASRRDAINQAEMDVQ